MFSHTNPQQNASPARPHTPQNQYGGPPFNERYDSSPETPPTTQIPNTSPASPGHGAAVIHEATPGLIPDTPPIDQTGRRGAIQADTVHEPERAYQDVDSYAFQNPWPEKTPDVPGGHPDVSHRCSHDLVYPCFCRNTTHTIGSVCDDCSSRSCSFNRLLQMGTSDAIQLELDRELARERQCDQFKFEICKALEAARMREGQVRRV